MKILSVGETQQLLIFIARQMVDKEDYLCELDGKIGDADHGIGIARGFQAVEAAMENQFLTINEVFSQAGFALMNAMGGASGIIFSSMFLGALADPKEEQELTVGLLKRYLKNGLIRIKEKGGASIGDKTMLDAFEPAVEKVQDYDGTDLYEVTLLAAKAAEEGAEKTKQYIAKFGRAKFLGERAVGFYDAGAVSVAFIFRFATTYLENKQEGEIA